MMGGKLRCSWFKNNEPHHDEFWPNQLEAVEYPDKINVAGPLA